MEIVLHAVMAAPKTKNFAEVKERFYLLCELGLNIASAKMLPVEKWLSPYEHSVPYRHTGLSRLQESWPQRIAVGYRRERQSAVEIQAPHRPFPGAGLLLSGV